MRQILFFIGLFFGLNSCWAFHYTYVAIYKSVDKEGHVTYSDTPGIRSKPITLPPIQSFSAPSPSISQESSIMGDPQLQADIYDELAISRPRDQETIWNSAGQLFITLNIKPKLRPGDQIELFINKVFYARTTEDHFSLTNVDRGELTLQVKIVDGNGQVVKNSDIITVILHRSSRLSPRDHAPR